MHLEIDAMSHVMRCCGKIILYYYFDSEARTACDISDTLLLAYELVDLRKNIYQSFPNEYR